ncbi:MAG TPA: hypothetical protein VGO68_02270 [Pyrinomonadaceae bacterium]|jgi:hypothetical protein|nr:hypothetical protein [Pyrinomonadaceae bacterium]
MVTLFERTIRHGNTEYYVGTDLDDAAIVDGSLRVSVQARVRRFPEGPWLEAKVDLVADFSNSLVEVRIDDRVIATVPLHLPLEEAADAVLNEIDILADAGMIERAIGTYGIEELIHIIPTDPFLGCLIKSAVSTTIGQVIRCWGSTERGLSFSSMAKSIGACLREHSLRMAFTFIYRAGRCSILLGFA